MSAGSSNSNIINNSNNLQERLHSLLNRLHNTTEIIKGWKESDDVTVHAETTTELIESLQQVLQGVCEVEDKVMKGDGSEEDKQLVKELKEAPVPLDLLELMDYGGGINPDTYTRALLVEAGRQLAGLKRRKLALELLGTAVSQGMRRDNKTNENSSTTKTKEGNNAIAKTAADGSRGNKRKRDDSEKSSDAPPAKKV